MSDITTLAAKLKAAAKECEKLESLNVVVYHGKMCLRNNGGIVFNVMRDTCFPEYSAENEKYARLAELASPANILALVEALEAAGKQIAELSSNNDSDHKALIRARHRTVTLPAGYSVRHGHPINEGERGVMIPKEGGDWLHRFDVEHALRMAGIKLQIEE